MHLSTIFCLAGVFLLLFWTVAVFLESQNIVGFGTIMEVICSSLHLSAGQGIMNCTGWPSQSPLQPFCRCFLRLKILSGCYHSRCWASRTPPALLQDRKTGHKQTSLCHSGFWPGFIRSHPSKSKNAYKFWVEKVQRQAFGGISQYWFLGLEQNTFTRASAGVSLLNMAYTPCYCFIIMYNWQ